jgi:twitching motility protein PilT
LALENDEMDRLLPPQEEIKKLLAFVSKNEASDLHLKVGYAPSIRIGGHLRKLQSPPLPNSEYVEAMLAELVPPGRMAEFDEKGGLDLAASSESGDRFRINMYRSTGNLNVALRRVQSKIPTFEELSLPDVYRRTIMQSIEGLVLVSGVTGSGKSSTLAAMLDYINEHRSMHMITIEDPIEYVFHPRKCIISQREIGIDVPNFHEALRFVVRQDPDCILIGEMRDRDTILAGIQAAETGHLVLGTLHCSDAQQTFSRILEFFPRADHAFVRSSLANSLTAIMCQRLLPGVVEGKRYPATEVLLSNSIVKEKILHEEDEDFPAIISQCREEGMRSFTQSLCELVEADLIAREVAMDYAPSREALNSALKGFATGAQTLVGKLRG